MYTIALFLFSQIQYNFKTITTWTPNIYNIMTKKFVVKKAVKMIKLIVLFFFKYFINKYSKYMLWMNLFLFVRFV